MSRVEEIAAAVASLPAADYQQFVEWFRTREEARWDQQMDHDSLAGKLDFLFEEAETEAAAGRLRDWPPSA